jgi:homoserine kinase type II
MAYTEVSSDDANELLIQAGLSGLNEIEPLDGGWANSNYILTLEDSSKVVLKVWDERTPEDIDLVLQNTLWLAKHGIPTPVPLTFNDGSNLVLKNGAAWMLMPYVEGNWLSSDYESLVALGKIQAQLHEIPSPDNIHSSFSMGLELWKKMFDLAEQQNLDSEFIDLLKMEMNSLQGSLFDRLPQGIIHGDLFPDNVLGSNGEISAILDFEEVCTGPKAFDLVMSFVGFGWEGGEPVEERWTALLQGYESVRPLSNNEKIALGDLHRYATLSIAAWRYWKFVMLMPPSENTNRYLEMVGRLDKIPPF